ncbi:MAG: electron transfer flavoprotein-ubiquinone oxidoreductase [Alphaproteobacteria bacterium]|nr:electron transfer flavoprotein-ubiquinone oxidoreductase [Alphaproteobacteria bacterium]
MEREEMPVDVLFVGAGPANLAGAIHLMNLIAKHNEDVSEGRKEGEVFEEPTIALLEKGSRIGAHQLSGAVLDPKALDELIPDWRERSDFPVERFVARDDMVFLTNGGAIKAPWVPPEMNNHGKPIVSLGRLCAWLGEIAEEKGVMVFPEFAGADLLWDGDAVRGVRTGDKGIGHDGEPLDNFEPGMDLTSPVTILGEGPRGHLARKLIERRQLDRDSNPMAYEIGCKEVFELPPGTITEGFAIHGLGYPLDMKTFGGWFLYSMEGDKACLGLLVALDAKDPLMDCHELLQKLKTHPYVKGILGKGKVVKYGAKTVTIGGWGSIPKLYTDGAMIVGDSASFLNPFRIKGIHLSMKSGMLAAEAAFEAMCRGEATASVLELYKQRLDSSWVRAEMEMSKNMHANFEGGFLSGMIKTGMMYFFGPGADIKPFTPDYEHMQQLRTYYAAGPQLDSKLVFDGTYLLDKLSDVYLSGTTHDEHQPAHLKIVDTEICATTCKEEYGNPCTRFCPAQVYNMVDNAETGRQEMRVDFSNCVHCKTCDIRDPYQVITWVPPKGGDGPEYAIM